MVDRSKARVLTTSLLILVSCLVVSCQQKSTNASPTRETAYQRVMRTGVLRAAYISYPPALMKDTATEK